MKSVTASDFSRVFVMLCLPFVCGVVCAADRSSNATSASLHKGALFVAVRAGLIKSGWKPVRMHSSEYEYTGTERLLAERHIYEVEACSTDRGSLCIFYYAMKKKCLRIDTVGEQVDAMRVTRWDRTCPPGVNSRMGHHHQ
jgi:hypothetical protein